MNFGNNGEVSITPLSSAQDHKIMQDQQLGVRVS